MNRLDYSIARPAVRDLTVNKVLKKMSHRWDKIVAGKGK